MTMFHAVMAYERDIDKTDLPTKRSKEQVYVNYNLESPLSEQRHVSMDSKIFIMKQDSNTHVRKVGISYY